MNDNEDKSPTIVASFKHFNMGHLLILAVMGALGLGDVAYQNSHFSDVRDRLDAHHKEIMAELDEKIQPLQARVTVLEVSAGVTATNMATVKQAIRDMRTTALPTIFPPDSIFKP